MVLLGSFLAWLWVGAQELVAEGGVEPCHLEVVVEVVSWVQRTGLV
jgi:hypothetical protein